MNLTIYYSVRNGGDGSAYPTFMESDELANWDQEHMDEGWGESCTGSFTVSSDSPITCVDKIVTKEQFFVERYAEEELNKRQEKEAIKFIEEFFPNGLPTFTVTTEVTGNDKYLYNKVMVNGVEVAKIFKSVKDSGEKFETELNNFKLSLTAKKYNV